MSQSYCNCTCQARCRYCLHTGDGTPINDTALPYIRHDATNGSHKRNVNIPEDFYSTSHGIVTSSTGISQTHAIKQILSFLARKQLM